MNGCGAGAHELHHRIAMNRAELEITAPINRDELLRLLGTMAPPQIEPEDPRLFSGVDWDDLLTATVSMMVTPRPVPSPAPRSTPRAKRESVSPFSHVAAKLPAYEPTRAPRATRPPVHRRATTQTRSLAVAETKAPRTVAEVRARLDRGETAALWAASCELSPQTVAELTAEEIALLATEVALPDGDAPQAIEPEAPLDAEVIDIHLADDAPRVSAAGPVQLTTWIASIAILFVVALCAAYVLG